MAALNTTHIYALFDPRSGLVRYIGKTVETVRIRFTAHIRSAKAGGTDYRDKWIRSVLNARLLPEVATIEVVPPGGDWQARERYWIAEFRRCLGRKLTNVTAGGEGVVGLPRTKEWSERIAEANRGKKRAPLSMEHRRLISVGNAGRHCPKTAEHREKIRISLIGRKNGPPSAETRAKIGAAHRGKIQPPYTPEQMEKWRAAQIRGENHHRAKLTTESVIAIRNEPVGGRALASKYGVSYSTIKLVRSRKIWRHI